MAASWLVWWVVLGPQDHRPGRSRGPRPSTPVESSRPSASFFEGTTDAEGAEPATCIFNPGVSGMVKIDLTCGERAKIQIRSGKITADLPIRAGNTLVTMLSPDGSLALVAGKGQTAEVRWQFFPRSH